MAEKIRPVAQWILDHPELDGEGLRKLVREEHERAQEESRQRYAEREREQAPLIEMMHKVIATGFRKLAKKAPNDPVFMKRLKRARDNLKIGV